MNPTRRAVLGGIALPALAPGAASADENILIHVKGPAGPPPDGAAVECAVPFARGRMRPPSMPVVMAPSGKAVLSGSRPGALWDDGSVRWLDLCFEASEGPGTYSLRIASGRAEPVPAVAPPAIDGVDLVITRSDGKQFHSALDRQAVREVEESSPMRCTIRLEGVCRAGDGEPLLNFLFRLTSWRARPEIRLAVTWINATTAASEKIRDIRLHVPLDFLPERLVFGAERGVFDGPFLPDWPVSILQEDSDQYWARTFSPKGKWLNLATGGANGARCPGWMSLYGGNQALSLWVRDFWEQYPNEIAADGKSVAIALWPEKAASHLRSKPILPSNPDGVKEYEKTAYAPVMPLPYLAFFDPSSGCLDVRQGMAKTQEILLSRDPSFETKFWSGALEPVRAHVDPQYACATDAAFPVSPGGRYARMFEECFGWFDRHVALSAAYGKFDYGDYPYMIPAPDYMTHPGTKWGHLGEMPREGYWHNNEGDPLLGMLLYYLRTGDERAWRRAKAAAQHLLDVDLRHFPYFGLYTHSYGHCYVQTAPAGAPDHSWLAGLLLWSAMTADPVSWRWVLGCGEHLLAYRPDFTRVDTRTVSVHLHMMCRFFDFTCDKKYLAAARAPAEALLSVQNSDGSWPAYMRAPDRPQVPGFVDHAIAALADYYALAPSENVRKALDAAIGWQFQSGELLVPLVGYALALLARTVQDARYQALAARILEALDQNQNRSPDPWGRGDIGWARFRVHPDEKSAPKGRPRQFSNQTRPLMPGFTLAYAQSAAAVLPENG